MSDSNRVQVAGLAEVTAGTAPAGPYQAINISAETLTAQKSTAESNTIRSDRNRAGIITTALVPQGDISFDMLYGNLDFLLPGMFGASAFSTPVALSGIAVTITSTNILTADSGTPFSVCTVGQWLAIVISGVKYFARVTAIGGSGASITTTGATFANGAATVTSAKGSYIRNGTTMKTYTLEVAHLDEATKGYFAHLGMVPNTFNINAQAEAIVTGSMGFLGMTASTPTDASVSGGAYTAAPTTYESFAGLSGNFGLFLVDGTVVTASAMAIKGIDISIAANARRDAAINVTRMGWGEFTVTGKLSTFFKGGMAAVDKFFSSASGSLAYVMTDPAGNSIVLTIGALKYTGFTKTVGGKNQPVMGDLDISAFIDSTYSNTLQLDLLPA